MMMDGRREWAEYRDRLVSAVKELGFPEELGVQIARQLGSPKAMDRMIGYLYAVKPRKVEMVVDEMLAICSDIDRWHEKKESEKANASYNRLLMDGFENGE